MATLQLVTLMIWVWISEDSYNVFAYKQLDPETCERNAQVIDHALYARPDILGHQVQCQIKEIERHEAIGD